MDDSDTHDLHKAGTTYKPIHHVHIGAGLFGLGMVMDLCNSAGFHSAVLNPRSVKERHIILEQTGKYYVIYDGDRSQRREITARFRYYDDAERDAEALDLLADPSVMLVTTAVRKDNLSTIAPLLALAITRRQSRDAIPLCILACENMPNNSTILRDNIRTCLPTDALARFDSEVIFCNTLVDRVCSAFECSDGNSIVLVESYSEWIVQNPSSPIRAIEQLEAHKLIELVDERRFKAYELRKYWCLNGIHLAIAALAFNRDKSIRTISRALGIDELHKTVNALQGELTFALRAYTARKGIPNLFSEQALAEYNRKILNRLAQNEDDTVGRILKQSDEAIANSVQQLLDRCLEQLHNDKRNREKTLLALIAKAGALLDVHDILDRAVERFIGPESEILAFTTNSEEPNRRLQFFDTKSRSGQRLVLDDAVQAVVIAIAEYARQQYENMQACLSAKIV